MSVCPRSCLPVGVQENEVKGEAVKRGCTFLQL